MKVLIQKIIKTIFLVVVCVDNRFTKPTIFYRGKNAAYEFIKAILEEYKYCKKLIEEYFNKNLIMTEEEEIFSKK